MNREALYQMVKVGALIPWALLAVPVGDATISFSLLLFQFVCLDLKLRYEKNN